MRRTVKVAGNAFELWAFNGESLIILTFNSVSGEPTLVIKEVEDGIQAEGTIIPEPHVLDLFHRRMKRAANILTGILAESGGAITSSIVGTAKIALLLGEISGSGEEATLIPIQYRDYIGRVSRVLTVAEDCFQFGLFNGKDWYTLVYNNPPGEPSFLVGKTPPPPQVPGIVIGAVCESMTMISDLLSSIFAKNWKRIRSAVLEVVETVESFGGNP